MEAVNAEYTCERLSTVGLTGSVDEEAVSWTLSENVSVFLPTSSLEAESLSSTCLLLRAILTTRRSVYSSIKSRKDRNDMSDEARIVLTLAQSSK